MLSSLRRADVSAGTKCRFAEVFCDGEARTAGTGFHLFSPLFVIIGHYWPTHHVKRMQKPLARSGHRSKRSPA